MVRPVGARVAILLAFGAAGAPAGAAEPFDVTRIPSRGRTLAAEIVDLDGDGRSDLLEVRFEGLPPRDRRSVRVHFQDPATGIPAAPQLVMQLPAGAAAYDLADVLPGPESRGSELLLLDRSGLAVVGFAGREPRLREVRVPDGLTAAPAPDERGLGRLPLASFAFGREPVLVVPGLAETFLLSPAGALRARLDAGARANYFVQPPGLVYTESDLQLFLDNPRLSFGDVDGDARTDVVAATRHELRVFLQRPDGSFPRRPSRSLALERVSLEDHLRGAGAVRVTARDVDADGRLDLLISQSSGGLTQAESITSLHLNRGGGWRLDAPDFVRRNEKAVVADQLYDVDGDGRLELLQGRIPLTVLELAEVFLTQSFDAHLALYRLSPETLAAEDPKPWFERKLGLPFSFDTARLRGFIPSLQHDLNGDGFRDFLHSADGSALEVYLGGAESRYRKRAARQELDVEGVLRAGDLDGDRLVDFALCNPRRIDAPILLLRNRGILPGTKPRLRRAPGG